MSITRRAVASAALLVSLLIGWPAEAAVDLAKTLVGRWEGKVQTLGEGTRENPERTLVISAVTQQEGKWSATGRWGITGKGLGRVLIEVDASGAHPWLRFVTDVNATIRVELIDDRHMVGTFTRHEVGGSLGSDRALKLEKKD